MSTKVILQITNILMKEQASFNNECHTHEELNLLRNFCDSVIKEIRIIHSSEFKKRFKRNSKKSPCIYCNVKTGSDHKKECPLSPFGDFFTCKNHRGTSGYEDCCPCGPGKQICDAAHND